MQVRLSDRDDTQDDDVGGPGSNDEEISGNGITFVQVEFTDQKSTIPGREQVQSLGFLMIT